VIYGALGQVWLDIATRDPARRDALMRALAALERAAASREATSEMLGAYGRALMMDSQFRAAEQALQQATRRYPVDPAVFLDYAAVAERQRHPENARRALLEYGTLVTDEPGFSARAERIGRLSLDINDPATASIWFARAAAARPDDLDVLALLADAQLQQGDLESARATIEQGLERDPDNPRFLALAGRPR
jgi:Flp pilus assembly protein TadD